MYLSDLFLNFDTTHDCWLQSLAKRLGTCPQDSLRMEGTNVIPLVADAQVDLSENDLLQTCNGCNCGCVIFTGGFVNMTDLFSNLKLG